MGRVNSGQTSTSCDQCARKDNSSKHGSFLTAFILHQEIWAMGSERQASGALLGHVTSNMAIEFPGPKA